MIEGVASNSGPAVVAPILLACLACAAPPSSDVGAKGDAEAAPVTRADSAAPDPAPAIPPSAPAPPDTDAAAAVPPPVPGAPPADFTALEEEIFLKAGDPSPRRRLLAARVAAGDVPRARASAMDLLRRHPGLPGIVEDILPVARASSEAAGDFADVLRGAAGRLPNDASVQLNCGLLLAAGGPPAPGDRHDESLFYLRRSADLVLGNTSAREALARRLAAAGLHDEALAEFRRIVEGTPAGARGDALAAAADAALAAGRTTAAMALADDALADIAGGDEPRGHVFHLAFVVLGLAALEEGREAEAAGLLSEAAGATPCPHLAASGFDFRLADALQRRGHDAIAADFARAAIRSRPGDTSARALLRRAAPDRSAAQ